MTDRDVYLKLAALADELEQLSLQAEGLVGGAALQTVANTVRGAAQAIYDHCLNDDDPLH